MVCKHIEGEYCTMKDRNGFCRVYLMACGDDSIKPISSKDKIFLKQILIQEVKIIDKNQKILEEFI